MVRVWELVTRPRANWPSSPVRLAWIVAAVSIVLVIWAVRLQSHRGLRRALVVAAAAAAMLALAELVRVIVYLGDGAQLLAVSSALSLFACTLITGALLRTRVQLAD